MTSMARREVSDDRSFRSLLAEASADIGALIRKEAELSKLELKQEIAVATDSAKRLGVAAVCGYLAITLLSFAAAWGLAEVMPTGFAFLIVGAVFAAVAAALFVAGRRRLQQIQPPDDTVATLKEDLEWLKTRRNSK